MNSQLYGKSYRVPTFILNKIKAKLVANPTGEGVKRAKFLTRNGTCTYQQLKRLKNFFDNYDEKTQKDQYELAGGAHMQKFISNILGNERTRVDREKRVKRPIMPDMNNNIKAQNGSVNLRENEEVKTVPLKRNALAIIFNNNMEILLLQRSDYKEQWQPGKWALVGGGVDEDETPEDAVKREIEEETTLEVDKFIEKFVLQRSEDSVEHMFITKYNGENEDVKIDKEHKDWGWFSIEEIKKLDSVPNLEEYVVIALEKYE